MRAAVADSLRSPIQTQLLIYNLAHQRGTVQAKSQDLPTEAAQLLAQEHDRLSTAELFYVTEDMTRLALAAAETLPVHNLHPQDIPTETGFMVFAEPIGMYLSNPYLDLPADIAADFRKVTAIVAATWGPLIKVYGDRPGVWITFWSATDPETEIPLIMKHSQVSRAKAEAFYRSTYPELIWDNETIAQFGAVEFTIAEHTMWGTTVRHEAIDTTRVGWDQVKDSTGAWSQVVRAAWLLMTQPGVAAVDDQPLSRTTRRRVARDGYNSNAVRVVRIRDRSDTPQRDQTSDRTYHVRWTVRGHWRNQWYRSRNEHRPVWINPHVKGPEGAPLRTGDTVHLLATDPSSVAE